jgi:hypothetical protein
MFESGYVDWKVYAGSLGWGVENLSFVRRRKRVLRRGKSVRGRRVVL